MLVPVGLAAVLVHAGAVPLPGRVEIRDQHVAAQVAGVLGVAAGAVPVVGPERRLVELGVVGFGRQGLPEPVRLPAAVGAREDHQIAADQSQQVTEQGRYHPLGRGLAAVAADDRGQGAQVSSAGCYRAFQHAVLPPEPGYSGRSRPDIRRTSDGGHGLDLDTLAGERPATAAGAGRGDMDEISQDPKRCVRCPRGRWLDVAVAVALIAAAAIAVMAGRGSRPAAAPAGRPGPAAPALLPSSVRARIPLPSGQPGEVTMLGSMAWISDWSASQVAGVDLAAGRVTRTVRVGDQRDEPVSMTSGAGSLWVLGFSGPLLRIDPASGAITKRFGVRGLGADVAYGNGFIWMITDEPTADGDQEYLSKIDPSRDVIVKTAPIPGAGTACAASPGSYGIWIACAAVDRITLISQDSLKPVQSLRVHSGGYIPQIVSGPKAVWVLTPSGLARADPATARITAIIHVGYAPSAMSAPALIMDSAGRLWITGSQLTVVVPGTLTAYPVARTPDLISAATDGPAIWADTGPTLIMLQVKTPAATQHTLRNASSYPR